jgi:hypothetical protein
MGCVEHCCPKCGEISINNIPNELKCPVCCTVMRRSCDEYGGEEIVLDDDLPDYEDRINSD